MMVVGFCDEVGGDDIMKMMLSLCCDDDGDGVDDVGHGGMMIMIV